MAHQKHLMTGRFTRLSGRDETSCKFSSRAKSLWNLRQSRDASHSQPQLTMVPAFDTDYTAMELRIFHPATLLGKVVEVTLDLQEFELWNKQLQ